jgi:penicillin-binding protein-related factor A (putative recombinase)
MLKSKVNYRLRLDHKRYKAAEAKSIKNRIDKQVEIIRDDQTTWLSSILDKKTHTRIVLDKVLVDEEAGTLTKR